MPEHKHLAACGHHAGPKPPRNALAQAVALAKSRSNRRGVRWTAQRQRALELLIEAGGPIKAYDLMPKFQTGKSTAPPTVYRALEALVALGVAHRIPSLNAFTACHAEQEGHSAAFLICDCCGGVEELALASSDLSPVLRRESDFVPVAMVIEATGRCARCKV